MSQLSISEICSHCNGRLIICEDETVCTKCATVTNQSTSDTTIDYDRTVDGLGGRVGPATKGKIIDTEEKDLRIVSVSRNQNKVLGAYYPNLTTNDYSDYGIIWNETFSTLPLGLLSGNYELVAFFKGNKEKYQTFFEVSKYLDTSRCLYQCRNLEHFEVSLFT